MTTASLNTVIDHTSDAAFRTWAQELITLLTTTLGLTQTADTGQINTATVTRPATSTAAGYVILRFNDAAQATSPVFLKLEFGTGSAAAQPAMWITVGTNSNGAGTLTGVVMARVAASNFFTPTSTLTPFITRGCYNTAAGFLGLVWKIGGTGTAGRAMGGFFVYRSADNTGAVTTDAVNLLTNSSTATGATTNQCFFQAISYLNNTAYTTAPFPSIDWGYYPFTVSVSLFGGNGQVGPCFQYTPVIGVTPWHCIALQSEIGIGSTVSLTLVGATAHTYISVGGAMGTNTLATQALTSGTAAGNFSQLMLWE